MLSTRFSLWSILFSTKETVNEISVEEYIEKAKRAFALKKYEQAVEFYASALDTLYVLFSRLHLFLKALFLLLSYTIRSTKKLLYAVALTFYR